MSKYSLPLFKAVLVRDVSYSDLQDVECVQLAGTVAGIECLPAQSGGETDYIATVENVSFFVEASDFRPL